MRTTRVLVISSDESLLSTQALILSSAGFEAFTALDLHSALRAAHYYRPTIVVIGHTLTKGTQYSYFERLEESLPGMHYVCLTKGVSPDDLLRVCQAATVSQPALNRVHRVVPSVAEVTSVA